MTRFPAPSATATIPGLIRQTAYNVREYGAQGDVQSIGSAAMTNGSAVLTIGSARFTAADVGKAISVSGAAIFSAARTVTDGAISNAGKTLTSATAAFTSADVGALVSIAGAGPNGGALVAVIYGYTNATTVTLLSNAQATVSGASVTISAPSTLATTIVSYQSPTQVTLAARAAATVSNVSVWWGTDDTAAIQAALTAAQAGGAVIAPAGVYAITSTLTLINATLGGQVFTNVDGTAGTFFQWLGAPNDTMVQSKNWKNACVRKVNFHSCNAYGVAVWDLDSDTNYASTSGITFHDSWVQFGNGGSCWGWRGAFSGNDSHSDISFINFNNCQVYGSAAANGDKGWVTYHANVLCWNWYGGGAVSVSKAFSNFTPLGNGGAGMCFYGFATSGNLLDFEFQTAGAYLISGGRFETGKCFMRIGEGGGTYFVNVDVAGALIQAYTPTDNVVFRFLTAANVRLSGCSLLTNSSSYTAAMFTLNGGPNSYGWLSLVNCALNAADPPYTVAGSGTWNVTVDGCASATGSATTGYFTQRGVPPPIFAASGLAGATAASRYVGATASGAPVSGTFALGDFVIDQSGALWVCTVAGSPGAWVSINPVGGNTPAHAATHEPGGTDPVITNGGHDLANAVETFTRAHALANRTLVEASGQASFFYFTSPITKTVTSIIGWCQTASSGLTLLRLGLYAVAAGANGALTLVAQTAEVHASAYNTNLALNTMAFDSSVASSYTMLQGKRYAIGILHVGTTAPILIGFGVSTGDLYGQEPVMAALSGTGLSDLPASVATPMLGNGVMCWFAVT